MSLPEIESGASPPTEEDAASVSVHDDMMVEAPAMEDENGVASAEDTGENNASKAEYLVARGVDMKDVEEAEPKDTLEEASSEAPAAIVDDADPTADSAADDAAEKSDDATSKSEAEQAAEDSTASKELPYTTRGRSTEKDVNSGDDKRSAIDALEELGRVKDASPATLGVSFLESLTDEERRTRTRFIPDVEGMHALRKHEVKDDLSLARSLVSSSGVTSLKRSKKRNDDMDADEEGGASPSEDGSNDPSRPRTKIVELPTRDLVLPSNAFISSDEDVQNTSISALKTQNGIKSPLLVDAVSGFNPPRPPESVGAKKKHRMLRWERRPEDVEVDLNNYQKTVQRTRQELQKAEAEYNRLETMDAHLRRNFLTHLNLMNEEYIRLNEEISNVQQECVKAADLLTSRTRSRGASKASFVMKDVLAVLKAKGAESEAASSAIYPIIENPLAGPGIGGLAPSVFSDWNRQTNITQKEPASAWTVPGEKVKTPYGEGIVVEVFPPECVPGVNGEEEKGEEKSESAPTNDKEKEQTGEKAAKTENGKADDKQAMTEEEKVTDKNYLCTYLMPRVSVRLPFGVGYFPITSIEPLENPCLFSDAKLAQRWLNVVKTALSVGGTVDLEGMNFNSKTRPASSEGVDAEAKLEVVPQVSQMEEKVAEDPSSLEDDDEEHFMPFGSGLLPTASGRGNLLHTMPIEELEKALEKALYDGSGVLGMVGTSIGVVWGCTSKVPTLTSSSCNHRNPIKESQKNSVNGKTKSRNISLFRLARCNSGMLSFVKGECD
jgi:hypothetical protein